VVDKQPMKQADAPLFSVALLSAAALSYEVLLIRLFSIIQWHHFAYMIISLALLGYGASGSFLALTRKRLADRFAPFFVFNIAAFGVSSLICYLFAQRIPFHPEQMLWDWRQWLRLPLLYLLLGIPFFFAANGIGTALTYLPRRASRTYGADLFGAGLGSLGIIGLLYFVFPERALRIISLTGLLASGIAVWELHVKRSLPSLLIPAAAISVILLPGSWTDLSISPYKSLPQLLTIADTRIVEEQSSPLGLLTVVKSNQVPLRFAPGLSLNATTEPPPQVAIFTDADAMTVITEFPKDKNKIRYLDYMTSALPYHLKPIESLLIIGAGGGSDLLQAHLHSVKTIDAVELNPQIVKWMEGEYAEFSGYLYSRTGTRIHIDEGRGFVNRHQQNYDLIQLSVSGSFGASSAGLYALNENYVFTVEAMQEYLNSLKPNGYVVITNWIKIPPRETFKLFATAVEALKRFNKPQPDKRMILIRGWQTATLLIKNGVISSEEIESLHQFCQNRSFDVAYYPGMKPDQANQYNLLQTPTLFYDAALALLGPSANQFLESYKFKLAPATDEQPYFYHFFKWSVLPELLGMYQHGGISLLESGYLVLIAALGQAIFFGLILILLPLWFYKRSLRKSEAGIPLRVFAYFSILGFAFFFIEVAFIQKFMLFLHHPIFAVTISLTAFLLSAGTGSALSKRWRLRIGASATMKLAAIGILVVAAIHLLMLNRVFEIWSGTTYIFRMLVSALLIAPLGFFMGMPFPQGLHALAEQSEALIPWAWGVNGYASVLSAILATLIAIHFGFTVLILLAMLLYGIACFVFPGK
jgi:hypothetical protein